MSHHDRKTIDASLTPETLKPTPDGAKSVAGSNKPDRQTPSDDAPETPIITDYASL